MTIDPDATVCQVHGDHKQGAADGSTHTLGYHPLLATRADSGEVLHARQRTGRANSARGTPRFVDELATLAHNLLRWIAQIGLGAHGELVVAKTLRRTLLALPGRLTRSARRWRLHLPAGWPWAAWFELALARLRCVAYAT
jgi:C4-dicarboxylate-specific signal transduction histidine kinase